MGEEKEKEIEPMCPIYDKCYAAGRGCKAGEEIDCGVFDRITEIQKKMNKLAEGIKKSLEEKGEFSCDEEWYKVLWNEIITLMTKNIQKIIPKRELYRLEDEIVDNFLKIKKKGGRKNEPF